MLTYFIRRSFAVASVLALILARPVRVVAQDMPFPVPPGLEGAVEFWKQIFTRYGSAEVVLFDPMDPATIYGTLRVPENEQGRALVEQRAGANRRRYDLVDDETRIRSQRGAKEHFAEGSESLRALYAQMQKIFRAEGLPAELGLFAAGRVVFQHSRALGCRRCRHVAVHAGDRQEIHAHRREGRRAARSDGLDAGGGASA